MIWICATGSPSGNFVAPGGHRPPLGSPYGRAGERSASLRGCTQLQIRKKRHDCYMVPSQSRLAPCQLSQRESQGRLRRPAIYHIFPNRVTPSGVGLLPGLQARIASGCNPPGLPKSPGRETGGPGKTKRRITIAMRLLCWDQPSAISLTAVMAASTSSSVLNQEKLKRTAP